MQLGVALPLGSSAQQLRDQVETGIIAEDLGFDVFWAAEAYGGDAVSVLAAVAARTHRIDIGSAIFQIPGRTPAMTAMTAAGIDAISQGRFRLGMGVSGPQVSEGWHGVRFASPLGRTREYVAIVRDALSRRRVEMQGKHFQLPLPDGLGKSLSLALRTQRQHIPIYLAAVGPKNMALAAEVADGWLGIFFDQESGGEQLTAMLDAVAAGGRDPGSFDTVVGVPVALGADAAARVRPYAALYIGGMGAKGANFYHRIATSMGYEREADLVQEKFLQRDYEGAAAAVPEEFLQRTCLLGDDDAIVAGLRRLADAGVTTVNLNPGELPPEQQREVLSHVLVLAQQANLLGTTDSE